MQSDLDIAPVSYLKSKTAEALRRVRSNRRSLLITKNGKAQAVLQDIDSYRRTREALTMLKILSLGEAEMRRGKGIPQDEVFRQLEERMERRRRRGDRQA